MLYDETAVRANIRNRDGKRVFFLGTGDTLTPSARDYLQGQRIEIRPADQAKITRYRLASGGYLEEKPEHMTHLHSDVLVPKTHSRIAFRGAVDSLEAELLLCQLACPGLARELGEILELARQLIRCEVMGEPLGEITLCGLTQEEQRRHSHSPQEYYGQPHFMPRAADGEELLWLNRCRCVCRAAELAAVRAFSLSDGTLSREDIPRALNRMSSMLYLLMLRKKAEKK